MNSWEEDLTKTEQGYPGFPVELGGIGELHAAFLTESRTRGRWLVPRSRKSGYSGRQERTIRDSRSGRAAADIAWEDRSA